MSESDSFIKSGGYDSDVRGGEVLEFIADEAIPLWGPVILVAAGSGETFPRVEPTSTANHPDVIGIAVDGEDNDNSNAVSAAEKKVKVMTSGRCKCTVNGNTTNIAIGDGLVTTTTDGIGVKVDFSSADNAAGNLNAAIVNSASVFAIALKASSADGDIIPVYVRKGSGDTA